MKNNFLVITTNELLSRLEEKDIRAGIRLIYSSSTVFETFKHRLIIEWLNFKWITANRFTVSALGANHPDSLIYTITIDYDKLTKHREIYSTNKYATSTPLAEEPEDGWLKNLKK